MIFFTLRIIWVWPIRLRPGRPLAAIAPIPTPHEAADAIAPDGVEFGHQFGVERRVLVIEERKPSFLIRLGVNDVDRVWVLLRSVVRNTEDGENRLFSL
jgi:hypothetical protein